LSLTVELKRQSHRGKILIDRYDPVEQARLFESLGVQALSVATDPMYYQGEVHHLTLVSQEVRIPVIRNDFVFDRYQVYEARAAGADAVILIAALLGEYRLWDLVSITQRLRMTAVVQVQNEQELARALKADPLVIAISNVDWRTLEVDLDRTTHLCPQIPGHIVVVSVGGIRTSEDMAHVADSGIDGVVVGEGLLGLPNLEEAVQSLFSMVNPENRFVR
ncbi:MAG: indole-3-glycerol-phosphate synthase, partial [Chloroflexi bacterium]|nr:indole-3-glycerol-phosphate synthase [Chloroflexota bacterium]